MGVNSEVDYFGCYADPTLAGNIGVVMCVWSAGGGTTTATVTDDKGSTYTEIKKQPHAAGGDVDIFTSPLVTGAHQFKLHLSVARSGIQCSGAQFYNTDGTSCGTPVGALPSGTSLSAGSITSSVTNCLYIQFLVEDDFDTRPTWSAGSGWTLLDADRREQFVSQYQVFAAAAAHDCSVTSSVSISGPTVCIALKPASQGTAPSTFNIVKLFQFPMRDGGTTLTEQAPCAEGNLIAVSWNGNSTDTLSSISATSPTATLTQIGTNGSNTEGKQYQFEKIAAWTNDTTLSLTMTGTISENDMIVYCISGANAQQATSLTTASGTDSGSGVHTVTTATVTPSGSNSGVILGNCGIAQNGSTSGDPTGFQENQDNNNHWIHFYYSSQAAQNFDIVVDERSAPGNIGAWSCAYAVIGTVAPSGGGKRKKLEKLDGTI